MSHDEISATALEKRLDNTSPAWIRPSLNWLLVFLPITLVLEHIHNLAPPVLFFSAALALIPIASLIVHATEQISSRTSDAVGGLLNATFGNAPELIIGLVALRAGLLDRYAHRSSVRSLPTCFWRSASRSYSAASVIMTSASIPAPPECTAR